MMRVVVTAVVICMLTGCAGASPIEGRWHLPSHGDVWVTFAGDGSWSANPSCETGTGGGFEQGVYSTQRGGRIRVEIQTVADSGCANRPAVAVPDSEAIADLDAATRFEIHGSRLTLFAADGRTLGTLVR